ncbi:tryptophan synthase subunit alpha [Gemmatimonas sp. UBA7669]|uniref:tryptophan synthase subunit alpha n=1 Tax=Gemmatimonas sp. UBA7669 TaxID=1946568 RepID=UPI0025BBD24B|nr:tryptophan synthase subunit alpha [Gemmatimonas sp. UBA7669]
MTTATSPVTSRLQARFASLAASGRKALVCYVTAGHPSPSESIRLWLGLAAAGADVLEVGVPFSDPMADGPVIQRSSQIALDQGMTLAGTFDLIREAALDIPVVLFSYLNPLLAGGDGVLQRAREAGVDGVLVTDLPVGADPSREAWFGASGLDFVRLVAPTTPAPRMEEIGRHGGGFVYLISRLGVTGERAALADDLPETVARLRASTTLPLCIGFGISTPEQAREAARLGDGVVVGSALVRAAGESVDSAIALAASMRAAMDELPHAS